MSIQDGEVIMALHRLLFFMACNLTCVLGKDISEVFLNLLHGFESSVVLPLDWLSPKGREPSLPVSLP